MKTLLVIAAMIGFATLSHAQYKPNPQTAAAHPKVDKSVVAPNESSSKSGKHNQSAKRHVAKGNRHKASANAIKKHVKANEEVIPPADQTPAIEKTPEERMEDEQLQNIRESQKEQKKIKSQEETEMENAQNRARSGVDTGKATHWPK